MLKKVSNSKSSSKLDTLLLLMSAVKAITKVMRRRARGAELRSDRRNKRLSSARATRCFAEGNSRRVVVSVPGSGKVLVFNEAGTDQSVDKNVKTL